MRLLLPLAVLVVVAACHRSGTVLVTNPRLLQRVATDTLPDGWQVDGTAVSIGFDATQRGREGAPAVRIAYASGAPYAGLVQRVDAAPLVGRTVTLEAELMRDTSQASVGIWVLTAGADRQRLSYVNSYDSVAHAPGRWARHRLTIVVPPTATRLLVGAAVHGASGVMWINRLTLRTGAR